MAQVCGGRRAFCPYGLYPPAHRASVPRARHVPPSTPPAGCLYAVDASCSTSPGGNSHPEGGSGPPVAIETKLIADLGHLGGRPRRRRGCRHRRRRPPSLVAIRAGDAWLPWSAATRADTRNRFLAAMLWASWRGQENRRIPSVLPGVFFRTFIQVILCTAGWGRTHDRRIMRSTAPCTHAR
jgi:hypothetical protein